MISETSYNGLHNCIEIVNGEAAVIVAGSFGPRILSYSLAGGTNVLGWHPDAAVTTDMGTWKPYGGHRLWMAPENMPFSYAPDEEPVRVEQHGEFSVSLSAASDGAGWRSG